MITVRLCLFNYVSCTSNEEEKSFTERDVMSEHEDLVTGWLRYVTPLQVIYVWRYVIVIQCETINFIKYDCVCKFSSVTWKKIRVRMATYGI